MSKILVRWPKYIAILYNFDKYGREIVEIRCVLYKKLSNAYWKLSNTT